jgi:hypothetical protein
VLVLAKSHLCFIFHQAWVLLQFFLKIVSDFEIFFNLSFQVFRLVLDPK